MAIEILQKCNEVNPLIAQDLLICEIDIFYNRTVLELAVKADAKDFVASITVQQLLNDIWFDKINPHLHNWQVSACFRMLTACRRCCWTRNLKSLIIFVFSTTTI
jgi:hypothetical protein